MTTTISAPKSQDESTQSAGSRLIWAVRDCWTIVLQEMTHLIRQPSTLAWQAATAAWQTVTMRLASTTSSRRP